MSRKLEVCKTHDIIIVLLWLPKVNQTDFLERFVQCVANLRTRKSYHASSNSEVSAIQILGGIVLQNPGHVNKPSFLIPIKQNEPAVPLLHVVSSNDESL